MRNKTLFGATVILVVLGVAFGLTPQRGVDLTLSQINSTPIGNNVPSSGGFTSLVANALNVATSVTASVFNGSLNGNASSATNAGHATNADYSSSAGSATTATNATNAVNATNATNAANATNAGHANNADNATNAGNATTAGSANTANTASALANPPNQCSAGQFATGVTTTGSANCDTPAPTVIGGNVHDVSGSRGSGVPYQNNTNHMIFVSGWFNVNGSNWSWVDCTVGPSFPSMRIDANQYGATTNNQPVGFRCMVPAGWWYQINRGGTTTYLSQSWYETDVQ